MSDGMASQASFCTSVFVFIFVFILVVTMKAIPKPIGKVGPIYSSPRDMLLFYTPNFGSEANVNEIPLCRLPNDPPNVRISKCRLRKYHFIPRAVL